MYCTTCCGEQVLISQLLIYITVRQLSKTKHDELFTFHHTHTLQSIVLHKIFSIQAVNQLSSSQAQLQQVELCCFLLRIGLFGLS